MSGIDNIRFCVVSLIKSIVHFHSIFLNMCGRNIFERKISKLSLGRDCEHCFLLRSADRHKQLQGAHNGFSDKLRGLPGGIHWAPPPDGGLLERPHILLELLRTAGNLRPVQAEVFAAQDCQHRLAEDRRAEHQSVAM